MNKISKSKISLVLILSLFMLFLSGCSSTSAPKAEITENIQQTSAQTKDTDQSTGNVQINKSTGEQQEVKSPIQLIETQVTRVVDGDTIHAMVNGKDEAIRLIGVDTPETVKPNAPIEPYGPEASSFTKAQLTGKTIWIEMDVQERDKYGRMLAYVWTEQPTEINDTEIQAKMFNAKLLLDGYGQLLTIAPDVKYVDYFTKYQTESRENNKGLWGIPVTPVAPTVTKDNKNGSSIVTNTDSKYMGNSNSHKLHFSDCRWAEKTSPANRVYFNTREEAINAGYVPCKVCNP